MGKFCSNCGKELNEQQDVCLNCGVNIGKIQTVDNSIENPKAYSNALTGFILGLVSILAWIIPLFGFPITICGIIWSVGGLKSQKRKGLAIAGLVLSIVFLVITLINSIAGAIMALENYY